MFTKKLLLALLFAPTLASAEPLALPTTIKVSDENPKQNVTWLSATLQLLYSIPEVKNALMTSTSTDPFVQTTAAFFKNPTDTLYMPIYNSAPKTESFDEPKALVGFLINNGLTSDQKTNLFSLQFDKKPLTNLFIDYTTLQSALNGEDITNQSKYLLIILDSLETTINTKFPIDIFTCKNNELIGFIVLEYTAGTSKPPLRLWKNQQKYRAYTKDPVENKWYIETFPIISSIDLIKNMPLALNAQSMKDIINQTLSPAYLAFHVPVILIYKKVEASTEKPSEAKAEDTSTFHDCAQAFAQI